MKKIALLAFILCSCLVEGAFAKQICMIEEINKSYCGNEVTYSDGSVECKETKYVFVGYNLLRDSESVRTYAYFEDAEKDALKLQAAGVCYYLRD